VLVDDVDPVEPGLALTLEQDLDENPLFDDVYFAADIEEIAQIIVDKEFEGISDDVEDVVTSLENFVIEVDDDNGDNDNQDLLDVRAALDNALERELISPEEEQLILSNLQAAFNVHEVTATVQENGAQVDIDDADQVVVGIEGLSVDADIDVDIVDGQAVITYRTILSPQTGELLGDAGTGEDTITVTVTVNDTELEEVITKTWTLVELDDNGNDGAVVDTVAITADPTTATSDSTGTGANATAGIATTTLSVVAAGTDLEGLEVEVCRDPSDAAGAFNPGGDVECVDLTLDADGEATVDYEVGFASGAPAPAAVNITFTVTANGETDDVSVTFER
jgi:uncharacterized protein (DUF2267 family)